MTFGEMEIGRSYSDTFLVADIMEKTAKTGKTFVTFTLLDGETEARAMMFDASIDRLKEMGVKKEGLVHCDISVSDFNGKSYQVRKIEALPASEEELKKFVIMPPYSPKLLFDRIVAVIEEIDAPDTGSLKALTLSLLKAHEEAFIRSSAAKSVHHNIYGGLAYHTSRMVCVAKNLLLTYIRLDEELLLCGTALHDLGKIVELDTTAIGNASYSVRGRLLGHATICIGMIHDEAQKGDYDPERILLLEHMIASHHGRLEWGAIAVPAIKEAMCLNYIDQIDAKMYQYEEAMKAAEPGCLTDRTLVMDEWLSYRPKGE